MANRGAGWWRTFVAVVAAALLLGVGAVLAYVSRAEGLAYGANVAQLVAVGLAIIPLLGWVVGWWRRSRQRDATTASTDAQLEDAQQALADRVRAQWESEVAVRQLDDPDPEALVVRWRLTELDVMDHAAHIARGGRLRFDGSTDRIEGLVRAFRGLRRRRLVIIGERGMGKTSLAVLMLRELLKHREPDDPVPILLSMSGWNPDEPLYDWLARRLGEDYPAMRAAQFGPTAPQDLVARHKILPVLDGLDELPDALRPKALVALNAAITAADPLILTCRTYEYKTAVAAPEGRTLAAGAVIEPSPLNAADVASYLTRCLPVRPGGSWPDLLSRLSRGALAEALGTPLTLWLLRKVYIDTWTDPAELCDTARFPTARAIKEHLLDGLVKALIVADNRRRGTEQDHPFHARHDWDPDDAQRWLGYLAHLLSTPRIGTLSHVRSDHRTRDLAWWQLYHAIPLRGIKVVIGLIAGLVFGLALSPVLAPVFALVGGLIFKLGLEAEAKPAYANLRLRGRVRLFPIQFGLALRFTLPLGLVSVPVFTLMVGLSSALAVGLTYALVGGFAFMLSDWVATPITDDQASTPASTLRGDLIVTSVHILAVGLTNALALGFAFGFAVGLAVGVTFALVGGLGSVLEVRFPFKVTVRVPFGFSEVGTAAAAYVTTMTVLAVKQRVPVRLMRFLDDFYRLGLLRRVGPIYQFRHAELQDRLASPTVGSAPAS